MAKPLFTLVGLSVFFSCCSSLLASCPSPQSTPTATSRYVLSVRDFGAVGDGIRDDQPAIQKALDCAQALRYATIVFPSGTYHLVSYVDFSTQLHLSSWYTAYSVQLIGNNSTLLSDRVNSAILTIEGQGSDSLIQGISFLNIHGLTSLRTTAIDFEGGSQNALRNWTIDSCTFRNVSRGIMTAGVIGMLITNNHFFMDRGRDSGTSGNLIEPNVSIWMFNNFPNGSSAEIEITGNFYDGCASGTLTGSASSYCGDGFAYGKAIHANIHNNHIQRFSFEGIFLWNNQGPGSAGSQPSVITSNTVDATKVSGDLNGGGLWGIRCDDSGASIVSNTVTNAVYGIWVYSTQQELVISNTVIKKNQIYMSGVAVPSGAGIFLSMVANTVLDSNLIILPQNTDSSGPELYGIFITGCGPAATSTSPVLTNNTIISYGHVTSGRTTGVLYQWTTNLSATRNTISGFSQAFHFFNYGFSVPPTSPLIQANYVSANSRAVLITN